MAHRGVPWEPIAELRAAQRERPGGDPDAGDRVLLASRGTPIVAARSTAWWPRRLNRVTEMAKLKKTDHTIDVHAPRHTGSDVPS